MAVKSKQPLLNTAILTITVATASVLSLHVVITVLLGQIDFRRCWDALDTDERYASVDRLSYGDAAQLALTSYPTETFVYFSIFMLTFVPVFWNSFRAYKPKTKLLLLIMTVLFCLYLWSDLGSPSDMHGCDRKGAEGGFLIVFAPVIFCIPLTLITWCTRRYFDREKSAK